MKLYLLNKSPQLKSLSHNLCHFSGHEQTRSFLVLYSQKWKATSIRKCLPVFFSQLCRPNAIVGFFSRFIRLSAPMFNDIIVLGCIMCLSTIYLFGIRKVNDANRTMPRICKVRSNVNFMWLSTSQTPNRPLPPPGGKGGEKDFIILSAFSMCNAFTDHCSYIHCFVGVFESFWKSRLNEGFLEWTVFWNEQTFVR